MGRGNKGMIAKRMRSGEAGWLKHVGDWREARGNG